MRRAEKSILDPVEIDRILSSTKYVTLAMVDGDEPYLVTLSHGFDRERRCLWFHCAGEGRKVDVLRKSPIVWGQALEDLGYVPGECDHLYATVHFRGRVTFVEDPAGKRRGLEVMIRQLEPDPGPVLERQVTDRSVAGVTMGRVDLLDVVGKKSARVVVSGL